MRNTFAAIAALIFGAFLFVGSPAFSYKNGTNAPVPGVASSYGFKTRTFNETWPSAASIDESNTKAAGFNWYVNSAFPNIAGNVTNFNPLKTASALTAGNISVTSNVMSLTTSSNFQALWTCVWNGSSVIGTTFGNGFYIDIQFSFSQAAVLAGSIGNMTFWFLPIAYMNGSISTGKFPELDGWEAAAGNNPGNFWMFVHEWDASAGTANSYNVIPSNNVANTFGTFDYGAIHHYGFLSVPQSKNGGTGIQARYIDNVFMGSQTYSSGGAPSPALTPSNPTGALSDIDSSNFCLALSSVAGSPFNVGQVQVFQ